jgi:CubicO group peptidase (beta-lactamase class C family)
MYWMRNCILISIDPNQAVQLAINRAIEEDGEIGMQVTAYLGEELLIDVWGGLADETAGRPVDGETLFPIFSVTKAVTAAALHIQAERGLVDYSAAIARYWPEFGVEGKGHATVYDALTHRLGLPLMPLGVTPKLMCDWDWMAGRLAEMRPLWEPGTTTAYHSYTFGWIVAEIVRRTDPLGRAFGAFVQDEIAAPLGIDSLFIGIPEEANERVAKLTNMPVELPEGARPMPPGVLAPLAIPAQVATSQEVYGRLDVRMACLPGAGGIMNSRSVARFFAMLANGGQLDGVRLLSEERVRLFSVPRPPADYDYTLGSVSNVGIGGFHLTAGIGGRPTAYQMAAAGSGHRTFGHPGAGGQTGWADPDHRLAVAVLHNRLVRARESHPSTNPTVKVGNAVREALGLSGT